jgi:hypothetical protein
MVTKQNSYKGTVQEITDSIIKGGQIQSVPTSGTTTVTQEMAQALDQSISNNQKPISTTSNASKENK